VRPIVVGTMNLISPEMLVRLGLVMSVCFSRALSFMCTEGAATRRNVFLINFSRWGMLICAMHIASS
jgi:hypothetical protein